MDQKPSHWDFLRTYSNKNKVWLIKKPKTVCQFVLCSLLIRFGGSGGRSIAWVLKSSEHQLVLGSCDVEKSVFGLDERQKNEKFPDGEVYVVLDQVNKKRSDNKEEFEFGLKIVNQKGEELAKSSNNALIVTDDSVGLVTIKGYYSINNPERRANLNSEFERMLKGIGVNAEFQANASEIDTWLKGGSEIEEEEWKEAKENQKALEKLMGKDGKPTREGRGLFTKWLSGVSDEVARQRMKSLFNSMWFEKTTTLKSPNWNVTVNGEWVSWCGTLDKKRDKRLDDGGELSNDIGGGYKKANSEVKLRVGPIRRSEKEQRWAIIPTGKPIMKVNLVGRSLDNETIEGTLEPMKDSYSLIT